MNSPDTKWKIEIEEVSASYYRVVAKSQMGNIFEKYGTDPVELQSAAEAYAIEVNALIDSAIRNKGNLR